MNLLVRSHDGVKAYTLCPEDTVASMRQKIGEDLKHDGHVKIYFPGIDKEIRDQDPLLSHFPNGVTINADLESASEDDEHDDTPGDGLSNDVKIGGNKSHKATQFNVITGINQEARGRATKAHVVDNEAKDFAKQFSGVVSSSDLEIIMNASAMKS
ncbi:hypothetical protein F5B21DRAFT_484655 [Xylaria acuta]|nr:hypothetical protein F5B21DRAFT_484655 [Xylaria acuta]